MNSADFYLLYLHLANQKTIKKSTLAFAFPPKDLLFREEKLGKVTKLQNQKLGEHRFAKEAFALLAFAGLRKTIAVAEWRNLFGYSAAALHSMQSFDFKSEKFCDSQALNNELSLHYKHSFLQKASKLKALARFKKTVNPLSLSSNNPFSSSFYESKSLASKPLAFASGGSASTLRTFALLQAKGADLPPLPKSASLYEPTAEGRLGKVKSQIYKAQRWKSGIVLNKKWMPLFNQRILSQSFRKNFIQNLKNLEKPLSLRRDFYENKSFLEESFGSCFYDSKSYLEYNKSSQTLLLEQPASAALSRAAAKTLDNKIANYFESSNLVQNRLTSISRLRQGPSREDHQMDLASWAPILDLREFKPGTVATREVQPLEKISSDRSLQITRKFIPQLKAYGLRKLSRICSTANVVVESSNFCSQRKSPFGPSSSSRRGGQDFAETTSVSHIKDFFGSTKKEILLASPNLTKFYNASWLLESIRTELSSRNANIKRVLNQTFLLTQQPLFNFSKKQTEKSTTLMKTTNSGGGGSGQVTGLSIDSTPLIREAAVIPYLIKGLRITFSGRLGGKKGMAKTLTKTTGRVPLSTLKEKVDFAKGVVQTKTGSLGVKVWICYN